MKRGTFKLLEETLIHPTFSTNFNHITYVAKIGVFQKYGIRNN